MEILARVEFKGVEYLFRTICIAKIDRTLNNDK